MKKAHYAPKQQVKKEKKALIEKLSNQLLVIFSTALVAEIVLLFLYTAFKSTRTILYMNRFMTITYLVLFGLFVALFVWATVLKKKELRSDSFVSKMKNWSFVVLAASVICFLILPNPTINFLFHLIGQGDAAQWFFSIFGKFTGSKGVLGWMILLALYVVVMFIVINVRIRKIKKSYK